MEGYKLIVLDEDGKVGGIVNVVETLPKRGDILPLRFVGKEVSDPYKVIRVEQPSLTIPKKRGIEITSDGETYVYVMPTGEKHTWAQRIFLGDRQLGKLERKFD